MTLTNRQLVINFTKGHQTGKSNNMEILDDKIIGYGHAIYADFSNKNGITAFAGWYGHSQSTTKHINLIIDYSNTISSLKPEL